MEPDPAGSRPAPDRRANRIAIAFVAALVVAAGAAAVIAVVTRRDASRPHALERPSPDTLPGALTAPAPWPANAEHLQARLRELGLPALLENGKALHIHVVLAILIDGRPVPIPPGIGLDPEGRFVAPIHTHDATGTIHLESDEVRTFRLGEIFDVWGLPVDARCLGPYCAGDGATLRFTVDGEPVAGDPRRIELRDGQTVRVEYAA